MGSKSKSSTANESTSFVFNNVDYGSGGGGGGLKNLNLGLKDSTTGDITVTDGGATRAAIEGMTAAAMSNNDVTKSFINGANTQTGKFVDAAAKLAKDNQDFAENITTTTLDRWTDVNSSLIAFAGAQNTQAQKAAEKALDYVFNATKSEQGRITENLSKWMLVVPGALVALLLVAIIVQARG